MCGIEDMEELKYLYQRNYRIMQGYPPYENSDEAERKWYEGWCSGVRSRMEIEHEEDWIIWQREINEAVDKEKGEQ